MEISHGVVAMVESRTDVQAMVKVGTRTWLMMRGAMKMASRIVLG